MRGIASWRMMLVLLPLIFVTVRCTGKKEEPAADRPQPSPSLVGQRMKAHKDMNAKLAADAQSENQTEVELQVVGISIFVDTGTQANETPMTIVLPKARMTFANPEDEEPQHVAYLAWQPSQQIVAPTPTRIRKKMTTESETLTLGEWAYTVLNREEVIIKDANTVIASGVLNATSSGNCPANSNDIACIPDLRDFVSGSVVNTTYLDDLSPNANVAARMKISHGTLEAHVADDCLWDFMLNNTLTGTNPQRRLAGAALHRFNIRGAAASLNVQLRNLDTGAVTDLVTLKGAAANEIITLRLGNSPNVFPCGCGSDQPDHHFAHYYDILSSAQNGTTVAADQRPLPFRRWNQQCGDPSKPTITCGPGKIMR